MASGLVSYTSTALSFSICSNEPPHRLQTLAPSSHFAFLRAYSALRRWFAPVAVFPTCGQLPKGRLSFPCSPTPHSGAPFWVRSWAALLGKQRLMASLAGAGQSGYVSRIVCEGVSHFATGYSHLVWPHSWNNALVYARNLWANLVKVEGFSPTYNHWRSTLLVTA